MNKQYWLEVNRLRHKLTPIFWGAALLAVVAVIVFMAAGMNTETVLWRVAAMIGLAEKVGEAEHKAQIQHASEAWKSGPPKWNACLTDAENQQLRASLENEKPRDFYSTKVSSLVWLSDEPASGVNHRRWGRVVSIHTGDIQYEGRFSIFPPDAAKLNGPLIEEVAYGWQEYIRLNNKEVLWPIDPVLGAFRATADGKSEYYMDCLREPEQRPDGIPSNAVWIGSPYGEQAYVELVPSEDPVPDVAVLRLYFGFRKMNGPIMDQHPRVVGPTPHVLIPPTGETILNLHDVPLVRAAPTIREDGRHLISIGEMKKFCDVLEAKAAVKTINVEDRIFISESYCGTLSTIASDIKVE